MVTTEWLYTSFQTRESALLFFLKWYKDALIAGSIMEIIERNFTATLAWDTVVKTGIKPLIWEDGWEGGGGEVGVITPVPGPRRGPQQIQSIKIYYILK